MELVIKGEFKNNMNMTSPAGTEDQNLEGMKHQEGHFLPGMRIFFLVIFILAESLDTKQFTVKSMQKKTIWEMKWLWISKGQSHK